MKRFIKYALLALSVALLTNSCDNYLTTPSQSQMTIENFYNSPKEVDQALTGIYGTLKPFSKYYFGMSELRSDNMFEIKESRGNDYSECAQFDNSNLVDNGLVKSCWDDHYTLIAAANVMIDKIQKVSFSSDEIKKQYEAEARFLRALSYFDLVRFYGRVPLSLHTLSVDEAFSLKQSEPQLIYEAIVDDLLFACENLQMEAIDYNGDIQQWRVTKMAAYALLGKVYMQMAGYPYYITESKTPNGNGDTKEAAKQLFKSVIDYAFTHNKYWTSTADEWGKQFFSEGDNKTFIFEIQYTNEKNQGNPYTPLSRGGNTDGDQYVGANKTNGYHTYIERQLANTFLAFNGYEIVTKDYQIPIYSDKRAAYTVFIGSTFDEETSIWQTSGTAEYNNPISKFLEHTYRRLYVGYTSIDDNIIDTSYWPQNFPILRIEDVMLLYAELVGNTAEGYEMLNRIHERATGVKLEGMSLEEFQEAVKMERRYELLGEGHRWFDQIRQNTFVNDTQSKFYYYANEIEPDNADIYKAYAARVSQKYHIYPIPLSQIQIYTGLYTQNEGY